MSKKSLILIVALIAVLIQSCNFPHVKLREIKYNPEMQDVIDKYVKDLEPEQFQISPSWFGVDTVITHVVTINVVNAKNMPEADDLIGELAIKIASDVYAQIINKDDYSKIDVILLNQSGSVVVLKKQKNYRFSYEDIEQFTNNRKNDSEN